MTRRSAPSIGGIYDPVRAKAEAAIALKRHRALAEAIEEAIAEAIAANSAAETARGFHMNTPVEIRDALAEAIFATIVVEFNYDGGAIERFISELREQRYGYLDIPP